MSLAPPQVPAEDYLHQDWDIGQELDWDEDTPDVLDMSIHILKKTANKYQFQTNLINTPTNSPRKQINKAADKQAIAHALLKTGVAQEINLDQSVRPQLSVETTSFVNLPNFKRLKLVYEISVASSIGRYSKRFRFSAFREFDKEWRSMFLDIKIDKLPRKLTFGLNRNQRVIDYRRKRLELYLRNVCQQPELRPFLSKFLGVEPSSLFEIAQFYKSNPPELFSQNTNDQPKKKESRKKSEHVNIINHAISVEKKRTSMVGVKDKALLEPKQINIPSLLLKLQKSESSPSHSMK
jgi:hypothetical protein